MPRLIEKARRYEAGRTAGTDLMNGYLYGDNDFIDKQVLAFLNTDDTSVRALVREYADDADVCRIVVELLNFVFLEADEGRLADGVRTRLISFAYNRLLMPVVYAQFAMAERRRHQREGVART